MPRQKQAQADQADKTAPAPADKTAPAPIACTCGHPHNRAAHGITLIGSTPHFRCASCGLRNPSSTRPAAATSTR